MNNRTDLINYLIGNYKLNSYCEIGTQKKDNNFNKIIAQNKTCVDPDPNAKADFIMTSDEFFNQNKSYFDFYFIDGLHTHEQVKQDFNNALEKLSPSGFILIHDTLPDKEEHTHVPRDSRIWFGDVYKFAMTLSKYENINFLTIDFDCGCTVVWKEPYKPDTVIPHELNWQTYQQYKKQLLRIVSVKEFIEIFSQVESIE